MPEMYFLKMKEKEKMINKFEKEGLYFITLGGADEIGMNMYIYAHNGKFIMVDAGYGF